LCCRTWGPLVRSWALVDAVRAAHINTRLLLTVAFIGLT